VPGRGQSLRLRRVALAGLVLGVGIAVRAALAVYALPLALLAARIDGKKGARKVAAFGVGLLPGIALVVWHNTRCFGGPFTTGYAGEGFSTPPWTGIVGLLFSPERSLLLYAPPLV